MWWLCVVGFIHFHCWAAIILPLLASGPLYILEVTEDWQELSFVWVIDTPVFTAFKMKTHRFSKHKSPQPMFHQSPVSDDIIVRKPLENCTEHFREKESAKGQMMSLDYYENSFDLVDAPATSQQRSWGPPGTQIALWKLLLLPLIPSDRCDLLTSLQ